MVKKEVSNEVEEARKLRQLVRKWVETVEEQERADLMGEVLDILDAHPEDEEL